MKRIVLLCLISSVYNFLSAQQKPQYTQYVFNNYLLNPALSGIESYVDLKAGYRNQWKGLEGAPLTSYISINAPLGNSFIRGNATSFPEAGHNPMSRSFVQTYSSAEPHHGIGFYAVNDKSGPLNRTDAALSYAYHLGLSSQSNLAVGVAAGFSKIGLDMSKIALENSTDPALVSASSSRVNLDLAAGLWFYGPRYFLGISGQQLLGSRISFSEQQKENDGKFPPHFFATGGYKLFVGEDFAAIPSVMIKYVPNIPLSTDVNMKIAFRDRFWMGGGYRMGDSFSALAGLNISYLFNISYAYDFTTSGLNSVSNGSHEIVLGLLLNNRYRVTCPQRQF